MRHRVPTTVLSVCVLLATMLSATRPSEATAAGSSGYSVLPDDQKRALALSVLAKFVPHAETYWRDSDIPESNTGRYLATGSGVTQARGAGNIAYVYATLLTARPDQESFGGVSRGLMLDHTIRSIRHTALTNTLSRAGHDRWGGGTWQASLETYLWGYAAYLLWDRLDDDTRDLVRRVVEGETDILVTKPVATATDGNTGAEDNAWNAPTPALAAVLSPHDPRAATWRQTAIKLALNASSMPGDAVSEQVVDGRPVKEWMASVNLHADLTMENHGFFNPVYQQVAPLLVGDAAVIEARAGRALPQAYSFRVGEVWEQVLGPLAADDGDIVMPAGQDWISKDYQHLDYLAILATRFGRADASVLESRALTTVAARQDTHADGSILGQPQLGYESMLVRRIAAAWWNHTLFGPSPVPSETEFAAARAQTAAVHQHPQVRLVQGRFARGSASMSWDSARPMGLVVPAADGHLDDPVFTYYAPQSLIGSAQGTGTYSCDCQPDRFSTAGTIGAREFSMTAFPDGVTLLLDRGTGSTFTYSMERINGIADNRAVYSAGGTGLGDLSGNWVNMADRMGMIVVGGSGISARETTGTNNTTLVTGSTATGRGNRGAVLLPLVDHQTTARLAPGVRQPAVPDGWSALLATVHDGTARLAVARWSGEPGANLSLTDPMGAPVLREPTEILGGTAAARISLDAPASAGETIRFFVHSDGPILARQDGADRAVLANTGVTSVTVRVTYVRDGEARTARRVVAPGETATARVVDGHLTTAGPEYEHLLAARDAVGALVAEVAAWQDAGRIGTDTAERLTTTAKQVDESIGIAFRAATADQPDTVQAAAAIDAALEGVARLVPDRDVPGDIRTAVVAAQHLARTELTAARGQLRLVVTLRAAGPALPGEQVPLSATVLNRGHEAATGGILSVRGPSDWTFPQDVPSFDALPPGGSTVVELTSGAPVSATPETAVDVTAVLSYQVQGQPWSTTSTTRLEVEPLFTVTATDPSLPLAAGGWNQVTLVLTNNAGRALPTRLTAQAPDGVAAEPGAADINMPAHGSAQATVDVTNESRSTGSDELVVTAVTSLGVSGLARVELLYSDNLARNPVGSRWPAVFADSRQAAFPEALGIDGDPATFWVAAGTAAGDGPSAAKPIAIGVDLGRPVEVSSVTMRPRVGYGPKTYAVQVSDDGLTWRTVAEVEAPNAATSTEFSTVTTRYLRLLITDSWDRIRPPRNVQIAELEMRR